MWAAELISHGGNVLLRFVVPWGRPGTCWQGFRTLANITTDGSSDAQWRVVSDSEGREGADLLSRFWPEGTSALMSMVTEILEMATPTLRACFRNEAGIAAGSARVEGCRDC